MTPDQRVLALWGGVGGAIIVVGCLALAMRGSTLSEIIPRARAQHATYLKLYHPDRPQEGIPAAEALQELNKAKERQDNALHKVEAALVPDLPKGYLGTEVNSAAATIHADHATMKTRAQSQQMGLPSTLPLDSGPDKDEGKRAIQLAQLYLYRAVVDQCLDAGVSKITAITPGAAESDPSGSYLMLSCDFDLDATYDVGQQLLQNLQQAHKAGIGVRSLTIDQPREGKQKIKLTASLLTANHGAVKPPERPRAETATPGAPIKAAAPRGRLGGG